MWFVTLIISFIFFFALVWEPLREFLGIRLLISIGILLVGALLSNFIIDTIRRRYKLRRASVVIADRHEFATVELFGLFSLAWAISLVLQRVVQAFFYFLVRASRLDVATRLLQNSPDLPRASFSAVLQLAHLHTSPLLSAVVHNIERELDQRKECEKDLTNELVKPSARRQARIEIAHQREETRFTVRTEWEGIFFWGEGVF